MSFSYYVLPDWYTYFALIYSFAALTHYFLLFLWGLRIKIGWVQVEIERNVIVR